MTDGRSASLFWNKAPISGLRPDLYYCQTVAGLLMWGALSDERTGLSLARVTVSSYKSVVSMYSLHVIKYIYICTTYTGPLSVQGQYSKSCPISLVAPVTTSVQALERSYAWPLTDNTDGLHANSSARNTRKTRPLLLRSADRTENTTHVIPSHRIHWRADCCLTTSYRHSSYCCVFTICLPSNGNTLPIFGQEFVFAGTCLPSCSLATAIQVTILLFSWKCYW
jgi:hypothetical protein